MLFYEKRVRYTVCHEWNVLSNALSRGTQNTRQLNFVQQHLTFSAPLLQFSLHKYKNHALSRKCQWRSHFNPELWVFSMELASCTPFRLLESENSFWIFGKFVNPWHYCDLDFFLEGGGVIIWHITTFLLPMQESHFTIHCVFFNLCFRSDKMHYVPLLGIWYRECLGVLLWIYIYIYIWFQF